MVWEWCYFIAFRKYPFLKYMYVEMCINNDSTNNIAIASWLARDSIQGYKWYDKYHTSFRICSSGAIYFNRFLIRLQNFVLFLFSGWNLSVIWSHHHVWRLMFPTRSKDNILLSVWYFHAHHTWIFTILGPRIFHHMLCPVWSTEWHWSCHKIVQKELSTTK